VHIDSPGLRTDLDLLLLQGSAVVDAGDHLVVRTESNPTFWWGNFLLVSGEARAAEIEHWTSRFEHEFPTSTHRAIGFTRAGGDLDAWRAAGWDVEVHVDLAMQALPVSGNARDGIHLDGDGSARPRGGIALRSLETAEDWQQSAVVGGGDTPADRRDDQLEFERRRVAAQRGLVESGRARWFGAFDGERLVANLGIVRLGDLARYQDVVTVAEYRRRGIAGALVRVAAEWAYEDPHVRRLVIVAEDGGPAIGLYERAGFGEVARHTAVSRGPAGVSN
jgi:ribosomal protein S18 acetylase RimI-like enzyme